MRESAFTKARRYLTEGRLLVVEVNENRIHALCRGDSGEIYDQHQIAGVWTCNCPAATDQCSHLRALRLVTLVRKDS